MKTNETERLGKKLNALLTKRDFLRTREYEDKKTYLVYKISTKSGEPRAPFTLFDLREARDAQLARTTLMGYDATAESFIVKYISLVNPS